MPVSREDVLALLTAVEPDYRTAARLGPAAVAHLGPLVVSTDPMLASKAAYLAGLIAAPESADVLRVAARSDAPEVRVAAASAARHLPKAAAEAVLTTLADDADPGVRRMVEKSRS